MASLLDSADAAAEVEANVETGIESLLKDLEDSPIEGGNLEPSNAEEDFLDRTSGTNSPLAPYPSSTPATTPSEQSPDVNLTKGLREASNMVSKNLEDTKLYGVIVDSTTSNFTTANWPPEAKFESTEAIMFP